MRVTRHAYLSDVIVLKQETLEKLVSDFTALVAAPTIECTCSDGLTRVFETLDEFNAFDNPPARAITSLKITSHGYPLRNHCSVRVGTESAFTSSCEIYLDAESEPGTELNDRIVNRLHSARPWYSLAVKVNLLGGLVIAALFVGTVAGIRGWLHATTDTRHVDHLSEMIAVVIGLTLAWYFIRRRYFRASVFALGQGESAYSRDETVRQVVVAAFGIGLVLIVLALLANVH
jgi:hypothetical protein